MRLATVRQWIGIELIEVSFVEKLVSILGGGLSILLLIGLSHWAIPDPAATVIVASMGASAVLLFAVPHGQLSQPWPVIGGHTISAIIGVTCAHYVSNPVLAAACAVGLAIGAMHQCKCIHPPGGATALTAVIGGNAIRQLGFRFVLIPALTNALMMVLLALLLNSAFKWRRYPASFNPKPLSPPQTVAIPPTHEEIMAAIRSFDSFVDISEADILRLTELLSARGKR